MIKRIIGALFIIIVFSVIVAFFASFGMAQNNADGAPAVELSGWWCNDLGPSPPNPVSPDPPLPDPPLLGKDVAWCEGQLRDLKPDGDPDGYNDDFYFTIHDGYPGYECTLNLTVHNVGDVTLWINEVSVTSDDPHVSVSGLSVIPSPIDGSVALAPDDSAVVIFTVTVLEGTDPPGTTYLNVIDGNIVVDDQKL